MSSACCRRLTGGTTGSPRLSYRIREPPRASQCLPIPRIGRREIAGARLSGRRWLVEAVVASGSEERKGKGKGICWYAVGDQRVGEELGEKSDESNNRTVEVVVAAGVTVVLGVGNRVLYKLALVPLKHYPFFLAQLATFG